MMGIVACYQLIDTQVNGIVSLLFSQYLQNSRFLVAQFDGLSKGSIVD
jgi:hypothetical protein